MAKGPGLWFLANAAWVGLSIAGSAYGEDLYTPGRLPALVADKIARQAGDSLTVIVQENATASNSAQHQSGRNGQIQAQARAGSSPGTSGQLGFSGAVQGQDQIGRSGQMVAQISVVVDRVLPNGDLHIQGAQHLTVDGAQTFIEVEGRVRPSDISAQNTIPSSRIADAVIDYDGKGQGARKTGPVGRVLGWLGRL